MLNFYKNNDTKEVIIIKENLTEGYTLINANTEDAALEKHVPYITKEDDKIKVRIGEVLHPMTEEHYIMFIALVDGENITKVDLKPGESPEAIFPYLSGSEVYAYCNLHSLWKSTVE